MFHQQVAPNNQIRESRHFDCDTPSCRNEHRESTDDRNHERTRTRKQAAPKRRVNRRKHMDVCGHPVASGLPEVIPPGLRERPLAFSDGRRGHPARQVPREPSPMPGESVPRLASRTPPGGPLSAHSRVAAGHTDPEERPRRGRPRGPSGAAGGAARRHSRDRNTPPRPVPMGPSPARGAAGRWWRLRTRIGSIVRRGAGAPRCAPWPGGRAVSGRGEKSAGYRPARRGSGGSSHAPNAGTFSAGSRAVRSR